MLVQSRTLCQVFELDARGSSQSLRAAAESTPQPRICLGFRVTFGRPGSSLDLAVEARQPRRAPLEGCDGASVPEPLFEKVDIKKKMTCQSLGFGWSMGSATARGPTQPAVFHCGRSLCPGPWVFPYGFVEGSERGVRLSPSAGTPSGGSVGRGALSPTCSVGSRILRETDSGRSGRRW